VDDLCGDLYPTEAQCGGESQLTQCIVLTTTTIQTLVINLKERVKPEVDPDLTMVEEYTMFFLSDASKLAHLFVAPSM
jgi:hypothetical protein